MPEPRIAVVGATGAVGTVTLQLLRERGYEQIRAFASSRSAGRHLEGGLVVEEATPEALAAGDIDLAFFSVGTSASRELVPHAVRGGAIAVDKSSAYRLQDGIPLVVPEVNGERAREHEGIVANPNCCAIPLTMALKPLHDAAGLARVRVSTYQSVSGAGARRMDELRATPAGEGNLAMDWDFDGEEFDEESKLRDETPQDPRVARASDQRDVRARPRADRTRRGCLGGDRRAALRRRRSRAPRARAGDRATRLPHST